MISIGILDTIIATVSITVQIIHVDITHIR